MFHLFRIGLKILRKMFKLILGYLIVYLSVFFHELMHVLFAVIYKIPLVKIQIGVDWLQINIGKLFCSPIIGTSFVETEYEKLERLTAKQKICYYLSGAFGNLLLSIIFLAIWIYVHKYFCLTMAALNAVMAVSSLLPFGNSDMKVLLSFLKKNTEVSQNHVFETENCDDNDRI